jgi:quinol-cytochrome oxidoreductase complex cytochrome b subunit
MLDHNVKMIKIFKIICVIILIIFAFYISISEEFKARNLETIIKERKEIIKEKNLNEPIGVPNYFPGNCRKFGYGAAFFSILVAGILLYSLKKNNYFNQAASSNRSTSR